MSADTPKSILPIRPKPLLYPKDSTILTNSRHSSKADQTGCTILVSTVMKLCLFRSQHVYLNMISSVVKNINDARMCSKKFSIIDCRTISIEQKKTTALQRKEEEEE